jgi:hypothetical protein
VRRNSWRELWSGSIDGSSFRVFSIAGKKFQDRSFNFLIRVLPLTVSLNISSYRRIQTYVFGIIVWYIVEMFM